MIHLQLVEQESFGEVAFDSSSANLHSHAGRHPSEVVLFVHGLGGRGYETWGRLPSLMYDGALSAPVDVAIFDYRSGRRALTNATDMDTYASQLVAVIRDLATRYDNIILVAHSLGGLVVDAATIDFLEDHGPGADAGVLSPVAGIVYFATPRLGAGLAISVSRWFGALEWLRPGSDRQRRSERFFTSHVESHAIASSRPGLYLIPRYACVGTRDRFVNHLSALSGVHEKQRMYVTATHGKIVKPGDADLAVPRWLCSKINEITKIRRQARREKASSERAARKRAPADIVTELWPGIGGTEWNSVYNHVRRSLTSRSIRVLDRQDRHDKHVDLLISVHDAAAVVSGDPSDEKRVRAAHARLDQESRLVVGISPVGAACETAKKRIGEWLTNALGSIYVVGSAGPTELAATMEVWIKNVIERDPTRRRYGSAADRRLQSDPDPIESFGEQGLS